MRIGSIVFTACCALGYASASAFAMPIGPVPATTPLVTQIADGCGPGWWRGPWGHCRNSPYSGRLPDGGYMEPMSGNGCAPGWWRGPWGHCRTTPYHGALPGGGWQY